MPKLFFMLVIGLFFGTGAGFLLAAQTGTSMATHSHDHGADHADADHTHTKAAHDHGALLENGDGPSPAITAELTPEDGGGLNIHLLPENFAFAPQAVNDAHVPGQGHAHIYVNGVKMLRAYGPWVHIAGLAPGPAEVRITLNANSHETLAHDGQPIDVIYQTVIR